jgi:hypothetical protein
MTIEALQLSRQTVGDQVQVALAMRRANHFNRMPSIEAHVAIVNARWNVLEALCYQKEAQLEAQANGTDRETLLNNALVLAIEVMTSDAEQFRFYEAAHRAKHTDEATEKAEVNKNFANRIDRMLKRIQDAVGTLERNPAGDSVTAEAE